MSRNGSQPSGYAANLEFTPDDLNNFFLYVANKLASSLPYTSAFPLSFCLIASSTSQLSEVSESDVISIINVTRSAKTKHTCTFLKSHIM